MSGDEAAEAFPRLIHLAALDETADFHRKRRVFGQGRCDAATPGSPLTVPRNGRAIGVWCAAWVIHKSITLRFSWCLQFNV